MNNDWYSQGQDWYNANEPKNTSYDMDFGNTNSFQGGNDQAKPTAWSYSPYLGAAGSTQPQIQNVYESPTYGRKPTEEADELPLLEELGINFDHIKQKTLSVLNPLRAPNASVIQDDDLAGPLVFCLMFGGSLLLSGKVQFGYIYGIGVVGCLCIYLLLNLMASTEISVTNTASVLGYCLLPVTALSCLSAVCALTGFTGLIASGAAVLWSSLSASKLFVTALEMQSQQLLVAYPCSLMYGVFALLIAF